MNLPEMSDERLREFADLEFKYGITAGNPKYFKRRIVVEEAAPEPGPNASDSLRQHSEEDLQKAGLAAAE